MVRIHRLHFRDSFIDCFCSFHLLSAIPRWWRARYGPPDSRIENLRRAGVASAILKGLVNLTRLLHQHIGRYVGISLSSLQPILEEKVVTMPTAPMYIGVEMPSTEKDSFFLCGSSEKNQVPSHLSSFVVITLFLLSQGYRHEPIKGSFAFISNQSLRSLDIRKFAVRRHVQIWRLYQLWGAVSPYSRSFAQIVPVMSTVTPVVSCSDTTVQFLETPVSKTERLTTGHSHTSIRHTASSKRARPPRRPQLLRTDSGIYKLRVQPCIRPFTTITGLKVGSTYTGSYYINVQLFGNLGGCWNYAYLDSAAAAKPDLLRVSLYRNSI